MRLGKKVVVGGPYPTSVPQDAIASGAHYLVLDEGEITMPQFLEALAQGNGQGIFRATEKPDVTISPIPRFDLLQRIESSFFSLALVLVSLPDIALVALKSRCKMRSLVQWLESLI